MKLDSKSRRKRNGDAPAARAPRTATRPRVSADDLPRKSLEECVKVAQSLHSEFAGKASWDELADSLKIGLLNRICGWLPAGARSAGYPQRGLPCSARP
jgi:hypothetical protein